MSESDLDDIVDVATRFNKANGITGLLMFNGLNFLQVLEGRKSEVEGLYSKILQDPRHVSVAAILVEQAETRIFPDWSMRLRTPPSRSENTANDPADILAMDMPETVRNILTNFETLKG